MASNGFPGQFQGGLTIGYLNIGAVQKQKASSAGFPGTFPAGLTVGYLNIGAVQKDTGGTVYTLTCSVTAFAVTGKNLTALTSNRTLTASVASFVVTGTNAIFSHVYSLVASVTSFIVTGVNVNLTYTPAGGTVYTLTCAVTNFAVTGIDVIFTRPVRNLVMMVTNFIVTGQNANLNYAGASAFTPAEWAEIDNRIIMWVEALK